MTPVLDCERVPSVRSDTFKFGITVPAQARIGGSEASNLELRAEPNEPDEVLASVPWFQFGDLDREALYPVFGADVLTIRTFAISTEHSIGSSIVGLLRTSCPARAALLEWDRGQLVLDLVVDRASDSERAAAFACERAVARLLPQVPLSFRLLDVSEFDEALAPLQRVIWRR